MHGLFACGGMNVVMRNVSVEDFDWTGMIASGADIFCDNHPSGWLWLEWSGCDLQCHYKVERLLVGHKRPREQDERVQ